jgi:hypothetical protein
MISRRGFLKTIGGTGVVFAASAAGLTQCDQMPSEAIAAWRGPDNTASDREWMLSYALLAPNPHNMQPWIVDLREENVITLFVDLKRILPDTDPYGRQILIGNGTFLELLNLAARERGYQADIHLFPEGEPDQKFLNDKPVARINLTRRQGIRTDPLFEQIIHRRSNKEPHRDEELIADHVKKMKSMALLNGQYADIAIKGDRALNLREYARKAILIEMETPRTLLESIERTRIGADEIARHRDGIDLNGPLFWWLRTLGMMDAEKAATPGTLAYQGGIDYAMGWVEGTHNMGWLATESNSRAAQVNAGRSYVRLNLLATKLGVAMHPVSQVLQEYPEMSDLQKHFNEFLGISEGHTVQMLYRLGYQNSPAPSPRRDLADIVRA